jgi:hypothetical protein
MIVPFAFILCESEPYLAGFLPPSIPPREHAHKTPSYDTKMLLKVSLIKQLSCKFKISNNFKQNIYETD